MPESTKNSPQAGTSAKQALVKLRNHGKGTGTVIICATLGIYSASVKTFIPERGRELGLNGLYHLVNAHSVHTARLADSYSAMRR